MEQQITEQEIQEFKRNHPNASLAEYINRRNKEIKQKLGMADSRKPSPGRMRFYDLPRSFQDLADVRLEDQEPARDQTQEPEPSAASSASGGEGFLSLAERQV